MSVWSSFVFKLFDYESRLVFPLGFFNESSVFLLQYLHQAGRLHGSKSYVNSGTHLTCSLYHQPRNCSFLTSYSLSSFVNVTLAYAGRYSAKDSRTDTCIFLEFFLCICPFSQSSALQILISHTSLSKLQTLCFQLNIAGLWLHSHSLCHGLKTVRHKVRAIVELTSFVSLLSGITVLHHCTTSNNNKKIVSYVLSSFLIVNNEKVHLDLFTPSWKGSLSSRSEWPQGSPFISGQSPLSPTEIRP